MTSQHFKEVLYSVMLTTQSDKKDICQHLNVSRTSLNKWLRYGLPGARGFVILDQLEAYLFEKLGGLQSDKV